MGDLRLQRAVNSLVMALSNFDVTLSLISDPSRKLRSETVKYLHNSASIMRRTRSEISCRHLTYSIL